MMLLLKTLIIAAIGLIFVEFVYHVLVRVVYECATRYEKLTGDWADGTLVKILCITVLRLGAWGVALYHIITSTLVL